LASDEKLLSKWNWIRKGYENRQGKTIDNELLYLARISAPFSQWIRFMWYWSMDGLPQWAIAANMHQSVVDDIKAIIETIRKYDLSI